MTPRERKPVDGGRLAAALSLARLYRQTGRPLELHDDAVADFIEALAEAHERAHEDEIAGIADETLYPTPEEHFWDDRTTPLAYSRADSENELERLRIAREEAWDAGYALGVHDEQVSQETTGGQIRPARVNPYRR